MKKVNLIYIVFFVMVYVLFRLSTHFTKGSAFFFGFAENKEVELNHDEAVLISKILVTPGQEVTEGQLLIEVSRSSIGLKIDNASHDLERLEVSYTLQQQNIENNLQQLRAKKLSLQADLEEQISTLEAKINLNQYLLEDLQTVETTPSGEKTSPNEIKLIALKKNLQLAIEPIDVEIGQLEASTIAHPFSLKSGNAKAEKRN